MNKLRYFCVVKDEIGFDIADVSIESYLNDDFILNENFFRYKN